MRSLLLFGLAVCALCPSPLVSAQTRPATRPFAVSKETTHALGPVRADGTIDYVAAINRACAAGVTAENNAAIPMLAAVGPGRGGAESEHIQAARAGLGMAAYRKGEPAFMTLMTLVDAQPPEGAQVGRKDADDLLYRATLGPWRAEDMPLIAEWLAANERPLALFAQGAGRPRYYLPLTSGTEPATVINARMMELAPIREMVRALAARAMLRLGGGDFEGYRTDCRTILSAGRLVSHGPTLLHKLVGIGCQGMGLGAVRTGVASGRLDVRQAKALLADMANLPAGSSVAEAVNLGERYMMLDALSLFAVYGPREAGRIMGSKQFGGLGGAPGGGGGGPAGTTRPAATGPATLPATSDWTPAFVKANRWYDRYVQAMRLPTYAERSKALNAIERDVEKVRAMSGGFMGLFQAVEDKLLAIILPAISRSTQTEQRLASELDLTRIVLRLRVYRLEKGEYPESLAVLAQGILANVPSDGFTGEAFMYRREGGGGYVLYSVGPNLRDDGPNDQRPGDDLVFRQE